MIQGDYIRDQAVLSMQGNFPTLPSWLGQAMMGLVMTLATGLAALVQALVYRLLCGWILGFDRLSLYAVYGYTVASWLPRAIIIMIINRASGPAGVTDFLDHTWSGIAVAVLESAFFVILVGWHIRRLGGIAFVRVFLFGLIVVLLNFLFAILA
ncbi:MAG: hypothetical protein LBV30_09885 [Propionibacteriaceae bacterium]|jgi:hypothetical protein|nr:hypothetical protein [Propionibacteriaceae bacterium]